MFLPKNRYNVFTQPDIPVVDQSGQEYTGPIIKTYRNERFKGTVGYGDLEQVFSKEEFNLRVVETPFNDYYGPTEKDYQAGKFTRYIIFDNNQNLYKEVNQQNYNRFKNLPQVKTLLVTWNIYQPAEDTKTNGYLLVGSATKNKQTLLSLEKDNPGIVDFLDPYQYIKEN